MGGWLRAQLLLAFIVGASITIFLLIIGVPYAFIIGIIGALAELVPMVGPTVAAIPAILLTLFQPTWQLILVIIFFVMLAQAEGNYLAPKIMQSQVGLSPLVTLLALLIGGTLAGMVGALLAIPLAAATQVFVERIVLPSIEGAESISDDR
jgi:predicted PurR-regulated permease PerM